MSDVAMRLNDRFANYTRVLCDGRVIDVVPLMLGRARITLSDSLRAVGWTDAW